MWERLIEIPEPDLVRAVFADRLVNQMVGIPPLTPGPLRWQLSVRPADLGLSDDAFGDADALVVSQERFDLVRACEFKRVKISEASFDTGTVSKLGGLRKAVHQANAIHAVGFAYVWLTVIVVADTRSLSGPSGFAAAPGSFISQVDKALRIERLNPAVGITICEIAQVSDRPANERGGAGGRMLRAATENPQTSRLSLAIEKLFNKQVAI